MQKFFGSSSPFDPFVEKVTNECKTSEDWSLIMDICDKVVTEPNGPKDCLRSIIKRLNNPIPHVEMLTLTLLDACISNCGKKFHLEVCSRDFENEIKKILSKGHPKVAEKLRNLIKKWAEQEFKNDPQLNIIPMLYNKMKNEGVEFGSTDPPKRLSSLPTDPNVVTSNQEEEDIAKAIELSLKENSPTPKLNNQASVSKLSDSNLYPKFNDSFSLSSHNFSKQNYKEPYKVVALYDFEAAEDNELTFKAKEVILVLDDSDQNWWKGSNHRGEGLFPSNFVTTSLEEAENEFKPYEKKSVQFNEEVKVKILEKENQTVEIDPGKIDKLLHLLHEADPTGDSGDSEELIQLEEQCMQMNMLIDQELEKIDRKNAALTSANKQLTDALNLYHSLMKDNYPTTLTYPIYQSPAFMSGIHYSQTQAGPQFSHQMPIASVNRPISIASFQAQPVSVPVSYAHPGQNYVVANNMQYPVNEGLPPGAIHHSDPNKMQATYTPYSQVDNSAQQNRYPMITTNPPHNQGGPHEHMPGSSMHYSPNTQPTLQMSNRNFDQSQSPQSYSNQGLSQSTQMPLL